LKPTKYFNNSSFTMNLFTSSILSLLLATVSSYEANESNIMEARVVINGLQGDLTLQDVQLVHETIAALTTSTIDPSVPPPQPALRGNVASVSSDEEHLMTTDNAVEDVTTDTMLLKARPAPAPVKPYCNGWGCGGYDKNNPIHKRGRWYGFGHDFSCGPLCRDDDKYLMDVVVASALIVSTIPISSSIEAKEAEVCEMLRQQGSPALFHATKCTITPMLSGPSVAALCVDGAKVGEALVFIEGATSNATDDDDSDRSYFSAEEAEVLELSVTDAYNEAYQKAGLVLQSFKALNMAVPPVPNKVSEGDVSSTVVMGEFHELCTDIDLHDKTKDLDSMHKVFEIKLCEKLHDSGLSIFQSVSTCAYRTFHSRGSKKSMIRSSAMAINE
jgi:hypothetical protein